MAVITTSCEDDYFKSSNASATIAVTATTQFSNTASRAVYEDDVYFDGNDISIDNYCLLLFDKNKILIWSKDISELPYTDVMPRPVNDGESYYALLLGNVTLQKLGITMGDSMDKLKEKSHEISRTYNFPDENKKNEFTWSGYLPFTKDINELNFVLNPNMAKITATIKNNSSDCRIRSVRIKNVANKVRYAQNALNKSLNFDISENEVGDVGFIDYDMEDNYDLGKDGSVTISWYVPHNQAGTGDRKSNAPATATYLQIDAVSKVDGVDDNNVATCYKVYPGIKNGNETYVDMEDFNVYADFIYNLNVTLNVDGVSADVSNGFTTEKNLASNIIKLPKNSNCYMIHPIADRIKGGTVYELPIDRVNQYWKDVVKTDASRILDANSEWTVEVIWQDINTRVLDFCDEYGGNKADIYNGNGLNPFCFKLRNDATVSDNQTYGNVLVGLKKAGVDGYLWSWHLWITDYNPDAAPKHGSNANNLLYYASETPWIMGDIDKQGTKFAVASSSTWTNTNQVTVSYTSKQYVGNVQHYHSQYNAYYTALSGMWETGIYKNKWIMDRHIGAQSPNNSEIENPLDGWGMYYQFGRKDPFIYKHTYDINGNQRQSYSYTNDFAARQHWKVNKTEGGASVSGSIENGVKYPTTYFTANGSWAGENTTPYNDWLSPTTPSKKGAKTLFDPCPPGWCVPLIEVFRFGDVVYGDSKFKEYTRTFAEEMDASKWEYTAVCSYVNVLGSYTDYKTYKHPDTGTGVDHNGYNVYNNSLTSYGDNFRNFSVLYSTDLVKGEAKVLKSFFPLQGHINGGDGKLVKVFQKSGITTIHNGVTSQIPDYTCSVYNNDGSLTGGSGLQVRVWGLQVGKTSDNTIGGSLMNIITSTLGNNVNARQEQRNGRLYMRFHGSSGSKNVWNASNGFNVRCIQDPYN